MKKEQTELKILRDKYNISTKEISEELNMSAGTYLLYENGKRQYKDIDYEEFYYEVAHALNDIYERKLAEAQQAHLTKNKGLSWKDTEGFIELTTSFLLDEEDEEEELPYVPLTEKLFKEALDMVMRGYNVIQVAVRLGVCEDELGRKIGNMH